MNDYYGKGNPWVQRVKVGIDATTVTAASLVSRAAQKALAQNVFEDQEVFQAEVLFSWTSYTSAGQWSLFSDSNTEGQSPEAIVHIKARIPELHEYNPPLRLPAGNDPGDSQADWGAINLFPTFVAKDLKVNRYPKPQPGQVIYVTFQNLFTQDGPIYLGPGPNHHHPHSNDIPAPLHAGDPWNNVAVGEAFKPGHIAAANRLNPQAESPRKIEGFIEEASYKVTVERWFEAMEETGQNGETAIFQYGVPDNKHQNGHRDTIIYVPEQFNQNAPMEIVYYFHGLGGFGSVPRKQIPGVHIPPRTSTDFNHRILRHIDTMAAHGRNFIMVIPECTWSINTSTRRKGRQTSTFKTRGESLEWQRLIHRKLEKMGVTNPRAANVTLIGHSNGGSPINNLANNGSIQYFGNGGPKLIIFSDSLYKWGGGNPAQNVWNKFLKNKPGSDLVLLIAPTKKYPPRQLTEKFLSNVGFHTNIHPYICSPKFLPFAPGTSYGSRWSHQFIGDHSLLYQPSTRGRHAPPPWSNLYAHIPLENPTSYAYVP